VRSLRSTATTSSIRSSNTAMFLGSRQIARLLLSLLAMPKKMYSSPELLDLSARSLAESLSNGSTTAEDLMKATLERIDRFNPKFNAIVSLRDREELLEEARQCDKQRSTGKLCGIPIAIKDLSNVAGLPTTMGGSLLYRFNYPSVSDVFVQRILDEGAIVIGKTNAPELGVGSHTFNKRWGTTVNPYDTTRSAGGSSGGAGVALATRMLCLADGRCVAHIQSEMLHCFIENHINTVHIFLCYFPLVYSLIF
jgi:hypothetical protein